MPAQMRLSAITLDCPDPPALAAFYQQATGLEPHPESNADFAGLNREDGLFLGFQRVDDYRPPSWPDQSVPQQLHLCLMRLPESGHPQLGGDPTATDRVSELGHPGALGDVPGGCVDTGRREATSI
ncbi:VOC family protein [Streptomyces sp. NPDC050485]|uniref:VOC family protein n=1 Tax=Streptomyces sp. NPDC050485 TaxID=3365617 RepID=UPI003791B625